ncbi:MAG: 30S ribosome-binding factor RbfA [Anaerolineaceae bacterium]|nr:30S ribosome-binding factor RbfA [Anaerolineaceae bacterium]
MPSNIRVERIAGRIKEELSELLIFEIRDPRLTGIFVTDVNVDRELSYASIYVSALEGIERKDDVLAGLNSAKVFIRKYLAKHINLRSFPQLRFYWDATPEKADQIERLLSTIETEPPIDENALNQENSTSNDEHGPTDSR